jgi:hypothetical protein
MKRTRKPYKGGRDDRFYARATKKTKAKLLARVKAEGYKSLGDWLEAQAMAKPNTAWSGGDLPTEVELSEPA